MQEVMHTNAPPAARARIVAAFLTIYLIWGTTFLGIRMAVETIPAFMMAGLRFVLAGGVMLPLLLMQGRPLPTLRQWRSALIAGGMMLAGGIGLLSFAEQRIPSGVAALMAATIPIWITLFDWVIFRGKQPSAPTFTGVGLSFTGVALLFAPALEGAAGHVDWVGMVTVLLGAMIFAAGSLVARRAPLPEDTRVSTASEMLAGGLLLLAISALTGEFARFDVAAVSPRSILALAYLVIFGSIIGYTAYLWLLKTVEPAQVGTNFFVNPVIAVFAGWWIAGETVTMTMVLAAAVIVLGVAVVHAGMLRAGPARAAEAEGRG